MKITLSQKVRGVSSFVLVEVNTVGIEVYLTVRAVPLGDSYSLPYSCYSVTAAVEVTTTYESMSKRNMGGHTEPREKLSIANK